MPTTSTREDTPSDRPPRENLVRATSLGGFELRATEGSDAEGMPTLVGHLGVFDQWTEINSSWEGRFMESIAPGAFAKTIKENRAAMKILFNHGQDPSIGEKVLGPIAELREDQAGAHYECPLLDTSYNHDLIPGFQANLYGNSMRMSVIKERFETRAKKSDYNPEGLPERTIQELRMMEFGPVTFPAYLGAQAGLRSLTDDFILRQLMGDPERLMQLLAQYVKPTALSQVGAEVTHSETESRIAVVPVKPRFTSQEEYLAWLTTSH